MNTAENLLKTLENHPLTKQILAEKAAETIERRKEAVSKIAELRIELENTPTPETGTADLRAELAAVEGKVRELREGINIKAMQVRGKRLQIEGEIKSAEVVLLSSYDERIDQAIEHFRELHEKFRQTKPSKQKYKGERNLFTETETFSTITNTDAIIQAMSYCLESISTLEGMKQSAEVDLEVIEALKAGVPSIDTFEEVTGTRTMPGLKGVNPLWAFPSDSEHEWRLGN